MSYVSIGHSDKQVRCKSSDMVRGLVPSIVDATSGLKKDQLYDASSSFKKDLLWEDSSSLKKDYLCVDASSRLKKD